MNVDNNVIQTIKRVIERELSSVQIKDVKVDEDFDHDGDPILRIFVVFVATNGQLETDALLGLRRHLREPLHEINEDRFPIFTFMTPEEASGAAA